MCVSVYIREYVCTSVCHECYPMSCLMTRFRTTKTKHAFHDIITTDRPIIYRLLRACLRLQYNIKDAKNVFSPEM